MNIKYFIFFVLCLIVLLGCKSQFKNISNNTEFVNQNDSINLYAFIGKKISVVKFDPNKNNKIFKR